MLFVERFSFSLTKYDWSTLRQWTKLTRIDWWTRNDSVFFFFQYSIDLYAGAFVCAWRRLVDHWMEWEGKLVLVKKEKWERIMKMFVKVYVYVCVRARIHIHRRFFFSFALLISDAFWNSIKKMRTVDTRRARKHQLNMRKWLESISIHWTADLMRYPILFGIKSLTSLSVYRHFRFICLRQWLFFIFRNYRYVCWRHIRMSNHQK